VQPGMRPRIGASRLGKVAPPVPEDEEAMSPETGERQGCVLVSASSRITLLRTHQLHNF
jgi:hypothetical protein